MKKTLQINLGGITFNIEEDAYEKLNAYLESIKKYFSSYEGSSEIVADIEARIAEKFFAKAQQNGVVGLDDVSNIVASMGTVDDFESVKDEEDLKKDTESQEEKKFETFEGGNEGASGASAKTRFFRDGKRKALGGVLSGLAHRYEIDVVWLRILFIFLAFGLIETGIGGFFFIAYLVAWVAMPERMDLQENSKIKKFYRNPENKVLGGVASGLSSYLNIDLVVIRVIMVIAGFFGIGILLYIVFWIVVPNANTLTQKMELQGQPLTLENIETNIKSQSQPESPKTESSIAKLLLFPFRLIGIFIGALGKLVRPAGALLRIFAGLLLFVLGVSFGLSIIVSLGVVFGFLLNSPFISGITNDHIINVFLNDFPQIGVFFVFLASFIPAVVLTVLGIGLMTGKSFVNSNFWQTTLILWLVGLVGSAAVGSKYAMNFSSRAGYSVQNNLNVPGGTVWLDMKEEEEFEDDDDFENSFGRNRVQIEASENQEMHLKIQYSAKGATKKIAEQNARNLKYNFKQTDSTILFDNKITFSGKKQFRDQHAEVILYLPKNKKFKMTRRFFDQGYSNSWHLSDKYSFEYDQVENFTFVLNKEGKIECTDCPKLTENERQALRDSDDFNGNFFDDGEFDNHGEHRRNFNVKDFTKIEFGSNYFVKIKKGAEFKMEAFSDHNRELEELEAVVEGRTLKIKYEDPFQNHDGKVNIEIALPELNELEISGAAVVKVLGFENQNQMDVTLSGASKLALQTGLKKLKIESSGASKIMAKGSTDYLGLELSGASQFFGKELVVTKADVEASGASRANLGKIPDLHSSANGGSEVEHE